MFVFVFVSIGMQFVRQKKRWEDNIGEWTGLEFGKSQRAVEKQGKMEKTGSKIICGASSVVPQRHSRFKG